MFSFIAFRSLCMSKPYVWVEIHSRISTTTTMREWVREAMTAVSHITIACVRSESFSSRRRTLVRHTHRHTFPTNYFSLFFHTWVRACVRNMHAALCLSCRLVGDDRRIGERDIRQERLRRREGDWIRASRMRMRSRGNECMAGALWKQMRMEKRRKT